jgi:hypothetical protein
VAIAFRTERKGSKARFFRKSTECCYALYHGMSLVLLSIPEHLAHAGKACRCRFLEMGLHKEVILVSFVFPHRAEEHLPLINALRRCHVRVDVVCV